MASGLLHRLIGVFMEAAKGMGVSCECAQIERLAVMIYRVMSYQSRQFHTLEHVFGFLDYPDTRQRDGHARPAAADHETALAAAFHDLVYYQVDDGLPPDLDAQLAPYLVFDGGTIRLAPLPTPGDVAYADCLALFGFEPGQELKPFTGLNEFLSALVMAKSLAPYLTRATIAAIAVCIEASVPFRAASPEGIGIGDALESRLLRLTHETGLEMEDEAIRSAVTRAIAFANVDVKDFAASDPGFFLSNTWKLLPESNAPLRQKGAFSIREYRVALMKMRGFFRSLRPDAIYHSYRGSPDEAEMRRLAETSRHNLDYALAYMQAKLLAVGLLEAAAEISGGDVPMPLFTGDLPREGQAGEAITSFLPTLPAPEWISTSNVVYRLLKDGRLDESSFDLKNSPLALYLYHRLTPSAWASGTKKIEAFFSGSIGAEDVLVSFDPEFRKEFLGACARMVPTRTAVLDSWVKSHESGK
jgi:hypothetical protein